MLFTCEAWHCSKRSEAAPKDGLASYSKNSVTSKIYPYSDDP